jgi:hypothetical protein
MCLPGMVRGCDSPGPPRTLAAVAVMMGVQGGRGLYRLGYVPRTLAPVVAALGGRLPRLRLVGGEYSRGARLTLAV